MPFLQDSEWPEGLRTIFHLAISKETPYENRYYGPYDKLLNYCFGDSFSYFIAPQNPPADEIRDTIDFIVFLVVIDASSAKPVLIVEIKDDVYARKAHLRHRADRQMRERYDYMLDPVDCPFPRLWGLSLLGTKMRVYCGDTKTLAVDPADEPLTVSSNHVLPPTFLSNEWDLDVLSPEGFSRLQRIVRDIEEMQSSYYNGKKD